MEIYRWKNEAICKMKISVLVVVYNEEKRLCECLNSVRYFDELLVVDLGSSKRTVEILQKMRINTIHHDWVPIGEMILPDIMPSARNDWILRVDPDEVLPTSLVNELNNLDADDKTGIIAVPFQYYFLNKKLDTTVWGGIIYGARVVNRKRIVVKEPKVHQSLYYCKDGYKQINLPFNGNNAVLHYWIESYSQLISKHERYLEIEGQARYERGDTFSWKTFLRLMWGNFKASFVHKSGWRGGWAGWFLSFFYAHYEARGWLALRKYENSQKQGGR
jgi:glycosyltransferase involved in cell wall biosynthesis